MTKLENHVTTLETSKRLKELNCPQESLFYWDTIEQIVVRRSPTTDEEWYISAYLSSELGELFKTDTHRLDSDLVGRKWQCRAVEHLSQKSVWKTLHKNEAEARGLMLAHLLEEGVISL